MDGGLTWFGATGSFDGGLSSVAFDSEGRRGFAAGWSNLLLTTEDGGVSWSRVAAEWKDSGERSICFDAGLKNGLIGGDDGLFRTVDGGHSWKKEPGDFGRIVDVWMSADGTRSAAVSSPTWNVKLRRSTYWVYTSEGGKSWSKTLASDIEDRRAVAFRGRQAIIAGRDGIFLKPGGDGPPRRVLAARQSR
jgi:photosystem II stability/assembly factor-like uncharacterized protein